MENNENLVLDGTENVEGTTTEEIVEQAEVVEAVEETVEEVTEKPEKTYTKEEVNQIVGKKIARERAKMQKENSRKYGRLENVLMAGTGKKSVEEITDMFSEHYESRGVKIPKEPTYTDNDIKVLARAEADELIKLGFDDVKEEADRLYELGAENMTPREKALFVALTDHINKTESVQELERIGVTADVYESKEFKEFAKQFNSDTPITQIYKIFNQTKPKKPIKPMGSIKNTTENNGVKDYYSPEEIARLTDEDLDNPEVWKAVRRSMTGG